MAEIINFPTHLQQYKLLWISSGKYKNPVYEVWSKTEEEADKISEYLKRKFNWHNYGLLTQAGCYSWKINPKFLPIPTYHEKQKDGLYHRYIEGHFSYEYE